MLSLALGFGLAITGCHNSSPQVDQTQTTGAPASNANDNGNGSGDHSGSAHPKGQQSTINGTVPNGAPLMDNGKDPNNQPLDKSTRPMATYEREPTATAKTDAGR
jgi:hypothetical protein